MLRFITLVGLLLTVGCAASREPPKSMCDLPKSFSNWENTRVRWQGILLDASPHGMMLVAHDCQRRGIKVERWVGGNADRQLADVIRQSWREPGVIRVDVTGWITGDGQLAVDRVHQLKFQPMSEQQEKVFWRSKGF